MTYRVFFFITIKEEFWSPLDDIFERCGLEPIDEVSLGKFDFLRGPTIVVCYFQLNCYFL